MKLWNEESQKRIAKHFNGRNRTELVPALLQYIDSLDVVDALPTNVRHLYYKMLSYGYVEEDRNGKRNNYQRISRVVTASRDYSFVPWPVITDAGRRTIDKRGVSNVQAFAQEQMEHFLNWRYYHRCRVQTQGAYIEILTEKEALADIFEEVIWPYCIRMTVAKGQNSATKVNEVAERMEQAYYEGKRPMVLCFNDLDPTGWAIPKAIRKRLKEKHGLGSTQVDVHRAGLNPEHIANYEMLSDMSFEVKEKDPNLIQWIADFTNYSYEEAKAMNLDERRSVAMSADIKPTELDAMEVLDLRKMIKDGVEEHLDMSLFSDQLDIETIERNELKKAKRVLDEMFLSMFPELFSN